MKWVLGSMGVNAPGRHAPSTSSPESEADEMRLFKRKTPGDDSIQCPDCGERVPEGAHRCAMCGHDLGHDVPQAATDVAQHGRRSSR